MAERFIISKFSFMFLLMLDGVVLEARAGKKEEKNVFILYMGAAPSMPAGASATDMHSQLLASVLKRNEDHVAQRIVHTYQNGFSGFAARLSDAEAKRIGRRPGVVSVFRDPILQFHTTRSWDFLQYQTQL